MEVFGITDYFSLDSYFEFKDQFQKLYPDSRKVFFANLELRLDVAVHHSESNINAHLIFPPGHNSANCRFVAFSHPNFVSKRRRHAE
ncbi:hypothetical protein HMPREF3120_10330 [Corynebacterium sp. HMSC11D10]|nr:hypothetical protein HMPREF3120_10330 [Corynebacterium sp. HMSC11D10]